MSEGLPRFVYTLQHPELWLQLLIVLVCLVVARALTLLLRRLALPRLPAKAAVISPFLTPALALFLLGIGTVLEQQLLPASPMHVVGAGSQIALVWLIARAFSVFAKSQKIGWLAAALLLPGVVLNILGLLEPAIAYLDGFALQLGSFKLSLYRLLKAAVLGGLLLWAAQIIARAGERAIRRMHGFNGATRELLVKFMEIILYCLAFIIVLNIIGIDLTALAVFGGALGVGLGFGLQKIASNFISGIILLMEKSVRIGDLVDLGGGVEGWVRKNGARYTLVETFDGREIMVPNEDFITSRVINWTYTTNKARIEIHVTVAFGADLELVRKLLLEAAHEHPLCSKDPEAAAFVREFGERGVGLVLFFWVDNVIEGRFRPQSEVMYNVWRKFQEHGIEFPYPQRDIHIRTGAVTA